MRKYLLKNGFVDKPYFTWKSTIHADSYDDACRKAKMFAEADYSCCVNSKRIKGFTPLDLFNELKSHYEASNMNKLIGTLTWCFDDDTFENNFLWERAWEKYHMMVADLVWWEIEDMGEEKILY